MARAITIDATLLGKYIILLCAILTVMCDAPNYNIISALQDVLFGRGTPINVHPGNRNFRSLLETYRPAFLGAKTLAQKRAIADQLYNEIQGRQCRFLEEDPRRQQRMLEAAQQAQEQDVGNVPSSNAVHPSILTKTWIVVEPKKALHKILKRLRQECCYEGSSWFA